MFIFEQPKKKNDSETSSIALHLDYIKRKTTTNPSLKQPVRQLSVGAARRLTVNVVSPVLLVSISVCSGDDKETGDDVKGSVGQPGKSNAF